MKRASSSFEWDPDKESSNLQKHGVGFTKAIQAFRDKRRIIARDAKHSSREERYFCMGWVESKVLTVRFTYRDRRIRIIGAGYWKRGEKLYEKENS